MDLIKLTLLFNIESFLMTDKKTIKDKINSDKILNNKVNFIKSNLAKIDKNIL